MTSDERMKFNVESCITQPGKRAQELHAKDQKNTKVPRAGSIILTEESPKPPPTPSRLPAVAPVIVTMYKVTDNAGEVWEIVKESNAPMFQVQMDHPVQRSALTYQLRDSFNDFLRTEHASGNKVPASVQELESCGIRMIITDRNDPDEATLIRFAI